MDGVSSRGGRGVFDYLISQETGREDREVSSCEVRTEEKRRPAVRRGKDY
jgi:hypothetical protein